MQDLIRRNNALQKVIAKYRGRTLDFTSADCIRMARTLLVALGHKPPKLPKYSDLSGARRALKEVGFKSIEALLDSMLPRIPAARSLPADLVLLEGEVDGERVDLDSVAISAGHKLIGWYDGEFRTDIVPRQVKAVYRV